MGVYAYYYNMKYTIGSTIIWCWLMCSLWLRSNGIRVYIIILRVAATCRTIDDDGYWWISGRNVLHWSSLYAYTLLPEILHGEPAYRSYPTEQVTIAENSRRRPVYTRPNPYHTSDGHIILHRRHIDTLLQYILLLRLYLLFRCFSFGRSWSIPPPHGHTCIYISNN